MNRKTLITVGVILILVGTAFLNNDLFNIYGYLTVPLGAISLLIGIYKKK